MSHRPVTLPGYRNRLPLFGAARRASIMRQNARGTSGKVRVDHGRRPVASP